MRIIEMPNRPADLEFLRDPKADWTIYVPVGSVAKGKALAGACAACHRPDLKGAANVPPLAGRSPTYLTRQMFDIQQGTRVSPLMKPVVAKLTNQDFVAIGAYLASLE
jgi:cytochrome c553